MSSAGHLSELDLLRGQVADLSRQLAERDRSMQDLREQFQFLRAIVEGTASETGGEFFASLVTHLTSTLHVQYAVISEVLEVPFRKIRTLAFSAGGTLIDNFEYDLAHTPCATALTQTFACFARDVRATFPQFQRLVDLGVESYCGVPLRTKGGAVIGLLVVMDTKPLQHGDDLQFLLEVFAPRIAAELERRRVEQEHARALAEIHNVIETVPDIMFTLDTHGNMVKWNRRVEDVTGYSPEELLNMPALAFVPPEEHIPTAAAIERAFTEGYAELEGHLLTKDYRLIPYHWTGALLKNPHGEPIGITGIGRDVSDKKRAEEALRVSEGRLSSFMMNSPSLVFFKSEDGRYLFANPEFEHMFQLPAGHIIGKTDYDVFPPEQADQFVENDRRVLQEGHPITTEETAMYRDGIHTSLVTKFPLRNVDGSVSGLGGFVTDITERKQVEKALCESEERYRTLVDLSPNGVLVYSNGKKVYVNQAACRIMGAASPEQLLENPTFHFSHPDNHESIHASIAQILVTGEPVRRVERKYQRLDGTAIFVEVDAGRIMWNGEPAIQVIFADITERKRAEESLLQSWLFLQSFVEHTPAAVAMLDRDLKYVVVSKRWYQDYQLSERSIIGLHHYDVFPEIRNMEHWQAIHRRCLAGEILRSNEDRLIRKGGKEDWLRWEIRPWMDASGSIGGIIIFTEVITDRKQAVEALRASEERLRLSLEAANQGIYDLNVQTGEALVSSGYVTMLDYDPATFRETHAAWIERLHPDDRDRVADYYRAYVAGKIPEYRIEFRQRTRGGGWRWILSLGRIVERDARGEPLRMVGTHTDITERKQAEEALREREAALARFKATLDQTHDCVFMFAPDTLRFIYCNRGAVEQVGYSEVELFTMTPLDLKPEFTERSFRELLDSLRDGRKSSSIFETVHRHKDGHTVAIEVSLQLVREQGAEGRFLAVVRDITERKQAEEALRASEERFDLAVRGSNTGIWDWDLRTGKTYFSPHWKSMLGYEEHELRGEFFEWEERLHPDDRERSSATVREYLEGTTLQYELEHRLRHKDGSYRWILARGVSIRDTEGKPYRMAGSHIDITEQKQTQEALAQSERQLRTVLDALPVGVWFTDRAGKPLLANPAAKQIWSNIKQIGLQTENPQAGWWETIGPANEPHRWALSHVLTTGVPSQYETFDFECLDGTKKTIRNSTVPVKNEAGVILGAIVLNEDITTLRQAQAALQLTQFSVDHAVEGFLWIGSDARIFHVNDSICRMLEYTWEELTTMTLHDIDPNLTSEVWPAHWEELKEKGSLTFESKYWSRTGRVLDMEVTVNYLQYEGKEYNCTIMRDIGERKRAEVSLRQSEERYRSLVDNAPIGIFLNEAGRFVYANREMLRILKAPNAEQLIGTPVLDRIAPEFHTVAKDRIRELTMGQPVLSLDEKFVRLDGSQVDVAVSAIPTSVGGNPVMQVLALDITERKQLAEREVFHIRQLKKLYELSMTLSGDPGVVLEHAVRIIGELFKVQVVCLSEIVGQELYFKSVYINGQTVTDAGHCSLAITPCAMVEQTKDLRIFDRVMERFPQASFLRDHQAVSYCGFPALDNEGRVVAVTCLLDNKPHEFSKEEQDLLRIFGQRIATEIARSRHTAEQKRAEKELRKSHAFIRQIIDTHPNFIFAKDREGRFTLVNKAVADVYGTTVENLIGKTDADFNPNQEEVASFSQQDLAVMDTLHELFLPEEVITGFDGRTRWLQTVKRPILDDEGCAIMVLGSSTDITEHKRMEEALRQRERALRAAIEERERISQDLHDGILQSLFAVGLALEAAKLTMAPRSLKTSRASLNQAIDELNDVMREIRNFIAGLGSDLLQGKSLPAALKQMLASLTEHQATRVRLAVEDRAVKALSTEQSLHLVRVVQEAVSNCIRHGHAQEARVSLKMLKRGVRLSVRDNGRGFNQATAKMTGHGLTNMAARAQKIGGRFTILSKVNEGTSIVLDLPKEAADVSR